MPSGSEIDVRYQDGHAGTTDEVARPLSDIAALPACKLLLCLELVAAGPKMALREKRTYGAGSFLGRAFELLARSLLHSIALERIWPKPPARGRRCVAPRHSYVLPQYLVLVPPGAPLLPLDLTSKHLVLP